jgi:hypothetical protein
MYNAYCSEEEVIACAGASVVQCGAALKERKYKRRRSTIHTLSFVYCIMPYDPNSEQEFLEDSDSNSEQEFLEDSTGT